VSEYKKMAEIICILDRSGSMNHLADEVIGGFNSFVSEQKKHLINPDNRLTLVLFDDKYEVVYNRLPLYSVPKLTSDVYYTRGMTALNDAIGKSISNVDKSKNRVIVLIQTDGQENSSQEYKLDQIKRMIKDRESMGWEFNFVGAGLEAFQQGQAYGVFGSSNQMYTGNARGDITKGFAFLNQQSVNYCNSGSKPPARAAKAVPYAEAKNHSSYHPVRTSSSLFSSQWS
jgi:hypothetical protein